MTHQNLLVKNEDFADEFANYSDIVDLVTIWKNRLSPMNQHIAMDVIEIMNLAILAINSTDYDDTMENLGKIESILR